MSGSNLRSLSLCRSGSGPTHSFALSWHTGPGRRPRRREFPPRRFQWLRGCRIWPLRGANSFVVPGGRVSMGEWGREGSAEVHGMDEEGFRSGAGVVSGRC